MKGREFVTVPCGQCIGCRLERSRQWAMRCVHESQLHEASAFVTLTYDDEFLPLNGSLQRPPVDFQKFMKRVRKWWEPRRVRFFHCGEYGKSFGRPHYHALLFGCAFDDQVLFSHSVSGEPLYCSAQLSALWGAGFCTVGAVTFESAAYVARYVVKKVTGAAAARHYERVDSETGEVLKLEPEYTTMSLKPGIGAGWFEKYKSEVYPSDEVVMRGRVMRPPRFYDVLLGREDKVALELVKSERVHSSWEHLADQSPARLLVRETVKEAQSRFLKRSLED